MAIVTRQALASMEPEARVHFLNDDAVRLCKSLSAQVGLTGLGVHHIEIEPGKATTEFHVHHMEEECIYMLSGTLELRLGDERHTLQAGDFVGHVAKGEPHAMRNVSSETATYLLFGQRLDEDVVDYPDLRKRLVISGDDSHLQDLPEGESQS